jgi:hypothetical protein
MRRKGVAAKRPRARLPCAASDETKDEAARAAALLPGRRAKLRQRVTLVSACALP